MIKQWLDSIARAMKYLSEDERFEQEFKSAYERKSLMLLDNLGLDVGRDYLDMPYKQALEAAKRDKENG